MIIDPYPYVSTLSCDEPKKFILPQIIVYFCVNLIKFMHGYV